MLKIVNLRVRSILTYSRELSWEIAPTTEDPLDYTFQIYRSEAEACPYETITPEFRDKYYFIDNVLPEDNLWRKLYYFISIKRTRDDKEDRSEIAWLGTPTNKYAQEISRIERLAFKMAAGTKVYVLPVRTFGQWCDCFDSVSKERFKERCLNCYNTSFVGGYMDAVETYMQIRQFEKKDLTQDPMVQQKGAVQIIASNYPILKPGDLIFQPNENYRWKVATIEPTRLGGSLVHQNVVASLVDRDLVEYAINIDDFDVFRPNYPDMLMHPRATL